MEKKKEKDWFDSPRIVTYIIIALLVILIIMSQSFAVQNNLSAGELVKAILNHNSTYLITLIYFVLLNFKIGKKYFDYLNVLMAVFYLLLTIASIFTIFQSFSLSTLVHFALTTVLALYFIYAFICNTVIGKELHLSNTLMSELKNDQYFYIISSIIAVDLVVSLISSQSFEGVVLIILGVMYNFLFARYIYLYKEFSDAKIKEMEEAKSKPKTKKKKEGEDNA